MGTTITCKKCGRTERYDFSEAINIGTSHNPVFAIKCKYCNEIYIENETYLSKEIDKIEYPHKTKEQFINEIEALILKKIFPERILQKYFSEEYSFYEFSELEGPFSKGPDFIVYKKKKKIKLELETDDFNYIRHKHHESSAFDRVEILAYLTHNEKIDSYNKLIPKKKLQLDKAHFIDWYLIKCEQNELVDNLRFRIDKVFDEYVRIFFQEICDRKEADMSSCPHCKNCAYFNEDIVWEFTERYLEKNTEILTDNNFNFGTVDRENLMEMVYKN